MRILSWLFLNHTPMQILNILERNLEFIINTVKKRVRGLNRDEIDDVIQDTRIKLYLEEKKFDPLDPKIEARVVEWARKVSVNSGRDILRTQHKSHLQYDPDAHILIHQDNLLTAMDPEIEAIMRKMHPQTLKALIARAEGYSISEVARAAKLTPEQFRKRQSNVRRVATQQLCGVWKRDIGPKLTTPKRKPNEQTTPTSKRIRIVPSLRD